jgi:protein-disulfide isomerase
MINVIAKSFAPKQSSLIGFRSPLRKQESGWRFQSRKDSCLRRNERNLILIFFIAVTLFNAPARAQEFSAQQKQQIETVVHDYLIRNPDVLRDTFLALEKQERERQKITQKKATEDYAKLLTMSDKQGVIGNASGDVTLVMFFDYNCGFCRGDEATIQRLIKEDQKLRVVLKEFPVLGTASIEAAMISAQLIKDKNYADFHHTLINEKGEIGKARALEVAKGLGFDTAKLEKGMKDDETRAVVQESYKLADALSINGTPAYVIGQDVFPGAQDFDTLKAGIANMRKCGKAEC